MFGLESDEMTDSKKKGKEILRKFIKSVEI